MLGIKKSLEWPIEQRLKMIELNNSQLSIAQQCKMVSVPRSSFYSSIQQKNAADNDILAAINKIYAKKPAYGSRRITDILRRQGVEINRKRTQRLMRAMNLQGIHPKRKLSASNHQHKKYPYIARDKPIIAINQVWSADITYLNTLFGTVYLVAIIDWHSRYILSWGMSNTMREEFCVEALERALLKAKPEIFNTDQGSQFTGSSFISTLEKNGIKPSMDGKGRATDNAPIERFWRSVKWEEVYLYEPKSFVELHRQIEKYITFYNHERPHQSLHYKTPSEAHFNLEKKRFDSNVAAIYTERELAILKL